MMTTDGSLVFFDHGIGRKARINLSAFIAVKVEPNAWIIGSLKGVSWKQTSLLLPFCKRHALMSAATH
jgi:hypothetical protein